MIFVIANVKQPTDAGTPINHLQFWMFSDVLCTTHGLRSHLAIRHHASTS